MADLRTDYKDDILDLTQNTQRKYRMITNDDGTVSFEDVTVYSQIGDSFGAAELNAIATVVNEGGSNMYYDPMTDKKYLKNQDGEWVEVGYGGLLRNYLYNSGDAFAEKTGEYEALGISNSSTHAGNEKAPVLTMESNHMNIVWAGNYSYTMGGVLNKKTIDLTEVNKLCVTYNASATGTYKPPIYFIVGTKNTTPLNNLVQQEILTLNSTSASGTIEIDVSAISGVVYYGVLFAISDGGNVNQEVNISSIWTE